MKYKVAVIGAGYFGQRHIKILSEMQDVEIVAVVDINSERLKELADIYNIKYFNTYQEVISLASVFFVVTPTATHFKIAKDLITAGKDVFVEKPLTENAFSAKQLIKKAIKKGVVFQIGLIERFNPAVITLLQHIQTPIFIYAERVSPFLGRAIDTDVTFDLMIHDLDLIWMILRKTNKFEVKDLKVFKKSIITNKIDFASVWIDFSLVGKPVKAHLVASRVSSQPSRKFSIIQENSALYVDLISKTINIVDKEGKVNEIPVYNKNKQPLYEEIRDFLNCVRERKKSEIAPSEQDIIEVIALINKINGGHKVEAIY